MGMWVPSLLRLTRCMSVRGTHCCGIRSTELAYQQSAVSTRTSESLTTYIYCENVQMWCEKYGQQPQTRLERGSHQGNKCYAFVRPTVCELYSVADVFLLPSIRYIFWLSVIPILRFWMVIGNVCVSKKTRYSSVDNVTRLQAVWPRNRGSIRGRSQTYFSSPQRPGVWGQPSLHFGGYNGRVPHGMKLTTPIECRG